MLGIDSYGVDMCDCSLGLEVSTTQYHSIFFERDRYMLSHMHSYSLRPFRNLRNILKANLAYPIVKKQLFYGAV